MAVAVDIDMDVSKIEETKEDTFCAAITLPPSEVDIYLYMVRDALRSDLRDQGLASAVEPYATPNAVLDGIRLYGPVALFDRSGAPPPSKRVHVKLGSHFHVVPFSPTQTGVGVFVNCPGVHAEVKSRYTMAQAPRPKHGVLQTDWFVLWLDILDGVVKKLKRQPLEQRLNTIIKVRRLWQRLCSTDMYVDMATDLSCVMYTGPGTFFTCPQVERAPESEEDDNTDDATRENG